MPIAVQDWRGRLPAGTNHSLEEARRAVTITSAEVKIPTDRDHPYRSLFSNGATLYPRNLVFVQERDAGPLGAGAGRTAVSSHLSSQAKPPWRDLDPLVGVIEDAFLRPAYLGENVLPFRTTKPLRAVIPWNGQEIIDHNHADASPGFTDWWSRADTLWREYATDDRDEELEPLTGNVDYLSKLSGQFPTSGRRIVYTKAGTHLAVAIVEDSQAVIDGNLYWSHAASEAEARYLIAIFNSPSFHEEVVGFQPVGLFGPRHFDKYVFEVYWPTYEPENDLHQMIVEKSSRAQLVAAEVDLPENLYFTHQRRRVRAALSEDGIAEELDNFVLDLLTRPD